LWFRCGRLWPANGRNRVPESCKNCIERKASAEESRERSPLRPKRMAAPNPPPREPPGLSTQVAGVPLCLPRSCPGPSSPFGRGRQPYKKERQGSGNYHRDVWLRWPCSQRQAGMAPGGRETRSISPLCAASSGRCIESRGDRIDATTFDQKRNECSLVCIRTELAFSSDRFPGSGCLLSPSGRADRIVEPLHPAMELGRNRSVAV